MQSENRQSAQNTELTNTNGLVARKSGNELLRHVIELIKGLPYPSIVFDASQTAVFANVQAHQKLNTRASSEITLKTLTGLLNKQDAHYFQNQFSRFFTDSFHQLSELDALLTNGKNAKIRITRLGSCISISLLNSAVLTIPDITSWQQTYGWATQAFWEWSAADKKLQFINTTASILGYDIQSHFDIEELLTLIHAEDKQRLQKAIQYARKEKKLLADVRVQHAEGHFIWIQIKARYLTAGSSGSDRLLGTITDISDSKQKEETIEYLAYHDELTGLPNKKRFRDEVSMRIASAERYSNHGAILHLSLERIKIINDVLGHLSGDELLKHLSKRISESIRAGDLAVRLGGDEFAILLGHQTESRDEIAAHALQLASKLINQISYSIDINNQQINAGASVGIATFPHDGNGYDQLLKHSSTALSHAKKLGGNRYHFFELTLETELQNKLDLQIKLRDAIHKNEFLLYYQPKIRLSDNKVIGAEALIRWQTSDRGLISPDHFIPLAEELGLIVPLGDWVINQAIEQLSIWQTHPMFKELDHIAVNVSPRQIEDPKFSSRVGLLLNRCPEFASKLEMEITESAVVKNPDAARKQLESIRSMGIKLAIDDFGTGYSALSHLRDLPFDILKIDRAFISEQSDHSDKVREPDLVCAIVSMSKALHLTLVAEGVESLEQLNFLKKQNCDLAQGYYYSPPVPAEDFWSIFTESQASVQNVPING